MGSLEWTVPAVKSLVVASRACAGPAVDRHYVMQPETSPDPSLPSFSEAVATFATFLEREGAPGRLLWVDRDDVTSHRRRLWVRVGDADEAARRAEARYEAGRERGFGISLRAICKAGASTACYVWVPKDETDASYAMQPRSLKCQVPLPLIEASVVRSPIYWHFRCAINGSRPFGNTLVSELPGRTATAA